MLYYTIPYYTIPYHTIPHHTTPHHTILYYTILYYTILYYTILYYTILYYTILYYTILYYIIFYLLQDGCTFLEYLLQAQIILNIMLSSTLNLPSINPLKKRPLNLPFWSLGMAMSVSISISTFLWGHLCIPFKGESHKGCTFLEFGPTV